MKILTPPPPAGNVDTSTARQSPPESPGRPAVAVISNTARVQVSDAELLVLRAWPAPVAKSAAAILAEVERHTGGWPKQKAGRLYAPRAASGEVKPLRRVADLFAWLHDRFGGAGRSGVSWRTRSDCVSKGVFFAYCVQNCGPVDAPAGVGVPADSRVVAEVDRLRRQIRTLAEAVWQYHADMAAEANADICRMAPPDPGAEQRHRKALAKAFRSQAFAADAMTAAMLRCSDQTYMCWLGGDL